MRLVRVSKSSNTKKLAFLGAQAFLTGSICRYVNSAAGFSSLSTTASNRFTNTETMRPSPMIRNNMGTSSTRLFSTADGPTLTNVDKEVSYECFVLRRVDGWFIVWIGNESQVRNEDHLIVFFSFHIIWIKQSISIAKFNLMIHREWKKSLKITSREDEKSRATLSWMSEVSHWIGMLPSERKECVIFTFHVLCVSSWQPFASRSHLFSRWKLRTYHLSIWLAEESEVAQSGKVSPNTITLPLSLIGSQNVFAMDDDEFEIVCGFPKPTPDETLVFSCAAGVRSKNACAYAAQAGYTKLVNYMGGAYEWFA